MRYLLIGLIVLILCTSVVNATEGVSLKNPTYDDMMGIIVNYFPHKIKINRNMGDDPAEYAYQLQQQSNKAGFWCHAVYLRLATKWDMKLYGYTYLNVSNVRIINSFNTIDKGKVYIIPELKKEVEIKRDTALCIDGEVMGWILYMREFN
uniref:Uncharacterized protein n=1 Tax=viral metagenome TaxID=1070528 RepID=A0A6M3K034_9ZZZZ